MIGCRLSVFSVLLLGGSTLAAQSVRLSMGSAAAAPGASVTVPISLGSSGGAQPVALQWMLHYPPSSLANVAVSVAPASASAGKSIVCTSTSAADTLCVLFGMNSLPIADGPIANVSARLGPGSTTSSVTVRIGEVIASAADTTSITASASTGTISLSRPAALASLICPPTIAAPGSVTCTVALTAPAPVLVDVTLHTDSPLVFVPSAIQFPPGSYSMQFAVAAAGGVARNVLLTADANGSGAQTLLSVSGGNDSFLLLNAASFAADEICSPGSVVTALGPSLASQTSAAGGGTLPTLLGGLQVQIGDPAPLYFVSPAQVNFQCPLVVPGETITVVIQNENGAKPAVSSIAQQVTPGLYALGPKGTGQGAVVIAGTAKIATASGGQIDGRPAAQGEFLEIYGNGFGLTDTILPAGTPAPADRLLRTTNRVTVMIDGVEVDPSFAGLVPGSVGLYQIDVMVPIFVKGGDTVPVFARVYLDDGRIVNTNTVTVAISSPGLPGFRGATVSATPSAINFFAAITGSARSQTLTITNSGFGSLNWRAIADASWIQLSSALGTAPAFISVSPDPAGLAAGKYSGSIQILSSDAHTAPLPVPVTLQVGTSLYMDSFASGADNWTISPLGNATGWSVLNGVYSYNGQGSSGSWTGDASWKDYTLATDFHLNSASDFPGGIRGRVNPATGSGYGVWVYPSEGVLKLFRIGQWNIDAGNKLLAQAPASIDPSRWHNLRLNFLGTRIEVYLDDILVIQTSDSTYPAGAIALDVSTQPISFTNVSVIGF